MRAGSGPFVRYDNIATVGRDHESFSSARGIALVEKLAGPGEPDRMDLSANMLISQDPPATTGSRR